MTGIMQQERIARFGTLDQPPECRQHIFAGRDVIRIGFRSFVVRQYHDLVEFVMALEEFLNVDYVVDATSVLFSERKINWRGQQYGQWVMYTKLFVC